MSIEFERPESFLDSNQEDLPNKRTRFNYQNIPRQQQTDNQTEPLKDFVWGRPKKTFPKTYSTFKFD